MKPEELDAALSRWQTATPGRDTPFAAMRTDGMRRARQRRTRLVASLTVLTVLIVAGGVFGLSSARRDDASRLSALRETHLSVLLPEGPAR